MSFKIVHIVNNDKFMRPYIDFINEYFDMDDHLFIYIDNNNIDKFPMPDYPNVINLAEDHEAVLAPLQLQQRLSPYMKKAQKVILHGLFSKYFLIYGYFNRALLSKCYWVIWGSDLYGHLAQQKTVKNLLGRYVKKGVVSSLGGIICYNRAEYDLAAKWYGAKGDFHQSFFYPSNLYESYPVTEHHHDETVIQIGNSADPTNNHLEVLEKLRQFSDDALKIYVPLSYGGSETYVRQVIERGKALFGDKFIPLCDFMPFSEYLKILSEVDIAIFNHNRQQAMGNITTLLGLGKKVYMKSHIASWAFFNELGITVFNIDTIDLIPMHDADRIQNIETVKTYFSKENLRLQWDKIFDRKPVQQ